jgi:hypothetical protein
MLLAAAGLMALGGLAIGSFDGTPSTPQPFASHPESADFDVQVHSRDPGTWENLEAINAQHGADCSAPPATHVNTSYEGSVFICRDHMMTALNASGYGVIYLTPNRMVDFSNSAVVSFDLSTIQMSQRDWVDIWITPYADNVTLPLESWLPDLSGPPLNALHIRMDSGPTFKATLYANGQETTIPTAWWLSIDNGSATVRERFELRLSQGHVWFGMPGRNLVWIDTAVAIPFSLGTVQFGHHSYTPTKDGAGVPATWHWDNISVDPSVPFTIIKANERFTTGGVITFPPAPAGASLRFSAVGAVTVNGVSATPRGTDATSFEAAASYFVPIAEGSTSATIGLSSRGWYNGPFIAKDFHLWALSTGTPPPTNTPIPTATSTAVSSSTATNTPQPTATATATPTAIPPLPTSTPAPTKQCTVRWGSNTIINHGSLTLAECLERGN